MTRKPIRRKEFEHLLNFLENDDIRESTRTKFLRLFTLLYVTGLRINEAAKITYGQLGESMVKRELSIRTSKTGEWRRIYLSDEAVESLKTVFHDLDVRPDDVYPFHPHHFFRRPPNVDRLTKNANAYLSKAFGSRDYTTHSFRAGVVTDMLAKTGNAKIVQIYLAHKSITTTLRYVRPSEEEIRHGLVR
ncbi:tyrosine-type recombinase/integrase [Hydrogenimonas sp.]